MASSKQDGTAAAAAEQLGSISLGGSAEKKDSETEPTTNNGTPTELLCSACGKKGDKCTLMKCRACKCVWYCDKECQNKHWKEHKKECKRIKKELDERRGKLDIGTEKEVGPLGTLPPQEECPICMRVLPLHPQLQAYKICCGKTLCGGCNAQHAIKKTGQTCAFCRTSVATSDEETLARLRKRVELKDPDALQNLSVAYGFGKYGLAEDQARCIDLLREAADLGLIDAQYQLGTFHHDGDMGLDQNEEEAFKYWEKAAEGGCFISRHNLGCKEHENDNVVAAMRQWRLSASRGYNKSTTYLIDCFEDGFLKHKDLAESLQSMYFARTEMRSENRNMYVEYLKRIGEYEAFYMY